MPFGPLPPPPRFSVHHRSPSIITHPVSGGIGAACTASTRREEIDSRAVVNFIFRSWDEKRGCVDEFASGVDRSRLCISCGTTTILREPTSSREDSSADGYCLANDLRLIHLEFYVCWKSLPGALYTSSLLLFQSRWSDEIVPEAFEGAILGFHWPRTQERMTNVTGVVDGMIAVS